MTQFDLPTGVENAKTHTQVLDRVRRWASVTDPRIVRRLWPAQPDGKEHALCPSCGTTMQDGMLITLNQMTGYFAAGPVQRALAAGDAAASVLDRPIEPGELWCVVCLPCLAQRGGLVLVARLHGLVEAALTDDPGPAHAPAA